MSQKGEIGSADTTYNNRIGGFIMGVKQTRPAGWGYAWTLSGKK